MLRRTTQTGENLPARFVSCGAFLFFTYVFMIRDDAVCQDQARQKMVSDFARIGAKSAAAKR